MMQFDKKIWMTKWGKKITGVFREDKSDWNTNQAILLGDEYFFNQLSFDKNSVALDIGSFVGSASLALASLGMQVIAVEPLIDNISLIQEALEINGFQNQVKLYHRAIGKNSTDFISIYHGDTSTRAGFIHEFVGNAFPIDGLHSNPEVVSTISLEDLFTENGIIRCGILKIDCEGGEWDCFQQAPEYVLDKIDFIVGEIHPVDGRTFKDFLSLLKDKFIDITPLYAPELDPSNNFGNFFLKRV
jgi:FkbM family methyltransferase